MKPKYETLGLILQHQVPHQWSVWKALEDVHHYPHQASLMETDTLPTYTVVETNMGGPQQ